MVMGAFQRFKRLLFHVWRAEIAFSYPLPLPVLERLGQHVSQCEQGHAGEIRLYIETALPFSSLQQNLPTQALVRHRAMDLFSSQRVWDTAQNNGVLIYLLLAERMIEIIADRGISARVEADVWQAMVSRLSQQCQQGELQAGLMQTVTAVSELLGQHFPLRAGELNVNELPDFPGMSAGWSRQK
jgi:hypothetical protein